MGEEPGGERASRPSGPWARRGLLAGLVFVVWNASFDLQLRRAGDRFVADQLDRASRGQPVALIAEAFQPSVRRAALVSTAAAGLVLGAAMVISRRRPFR